MPGLLRWVDFWTPRLSNEVRVAYSRDFEYETAQPPLPQEPAIGPGGYAPEVSIAPQGFTFGTPASLGRLAYPDEHRAQVAELLAWVHGHHLLQFGADVSFVEDTISSLSNQEGTFHYDSGATNGKAGGLVDWITDYTFGVHAYPNGGCPSITAKDHLFCFRSFTQSFGEQAVQFNTQEWAGFVQDTWQARKRVSLSLGLRYEYEFEPLPQQPNFALDAVFGSVGATSVIPEDRNNLGPRVGVAWEPMGRGRGMVRLGYGLYFGRLPGATIRTALADTALPGSTTSIRITPATETICPQVANQGFGYACSYIAAPPAAIAATTTATVFDHRFRLPMVQQGSFGLERELRAGITVSAAYVMNMDRQLPNSVDINIAPSSGIGRFQLQGGPIAGSGPLGVTNGETFVVPIYTARVSTKYGPVTDIVSNTNATYNGLVLEARKHSRGGLNLRVSWSWAKAIDDGQNNGAVPRTNGQFDPFTNRYDRGLSTLNVAHKITATAAWEPTLVTPEAWLRAVANGWSIAPLFTAQSGRPYTYEVFGGTRLSGGHTSINGSGGAVYLPTIGRNTLRLPETANLDLRLGRTFRLRERVQLRATAEVFNLENRVNYTSITTRAYLVGPAVGGVTPLIFQDAATVASEGLNVQPFGTYTTASSNSARERQLQLSFKLVF
jgi:TonB dependent receptor